MEDLWALRERYDALRIWEVEQAGASTHRRWLANKAYEMRLAPTRAETAMWRILNEIVEDFIPQHIIGRYIVDFYCPHHNLIIEIDGPSHVGREDADAKRQRYLERLGYNGIRFTNKQVLEHPEATRWELQRYIEALA